MDELEAAQPPPVKARRHSPEQKVAVVSPHVQATGESVRDFCTVPIDFGACVSDENGAATSQTSLNSSKSTNLPVAAPPAAADSVIMYDVEVSQLHHAIFLAADMSVLTLTL